MWVSMSQNPIYKHIFLSHTSQKSALNPNTMTRLQYEKNPIPSWYHSHPSEKGKQRNDNNKFASRNKKMFQLLKPLTKWPPIWGGEGGVPHGNYVAQLDLEKSTTYPCMFCHSNLPSWQHWGGGGWRIRSSFGPRQKV